MLRIAIVGAGVMGAATAWRLAQRGHDVEVHEQKRTCAFGLEFNRIARRRPLSASR